MGTPLGFSHSGSMTGHWLAGVVYRALACATGRPHPGVHSLPVQSTHAAGGSFDIPSHQTSPSGVSPTLVKMLFFFMVTIALRLEELDVPGATPKNPASGLMAYSRPSSPTCIHAISSPTVLTVQPGIVGTSMARLVFPQALGNPAAM
jgi:hypothetical protein